MRMTFVRWVLALEAATFLLASLLHLGVAVPLLSTLGEPLMPQAGIPEGIIGLVLAAAAVVAFAGSSLARPAIVIALVFAILGLLVGMFALAYGLAPATAANQLYHRVVLVALVATVVVALLPGGPQARRSS